MAYGSDFDEIEKELDSTYEELVSLKTPVGLAHNDIWHSNILFDKENGNLFRFYANVVNKISKCVGCFLFLMSIL